MRAAEYASYDGLGLAELIRKGDITAVEAVDAAIELIEQLNPNLNAVIHTSFERARAEAAGKLPVGPFRGVPFLLKDLAGGNLAGDPHHWGTRFLRDADYRPQTTSYVVEKFRAAGLVIVGRTNVPELGAWATTEPEAYGACRNPWNPSHSSGGSSGGAASAVAAGIVPVAHASDGGGSIRNPASQCGLVGLKPTRGRISLGPDVGELWAGMVYEFAVTRSVRDTAALLDCVHGMMPGDPYGAAPPERPYLQEVGADPGKLRIGVLAHHDDTPVHPDCARAAESAAQLLLGLGHQVETSYPPDLASAALSAHLLAVVSSFQAHEIDVLGEAIGREIGAKDMDSDNWVVAQLGRQVSATRYLEALDAYHRFQRRMGEWWAGGFDLLVTPTLAAPPPKIGELVPDPAAPMDAFIRSGNLLIYLAPFNVTGQPAMSLPLYWNDAGLPIGVQLVAAYGCEDVLMRVASQLEQAVSWGKRRPSVHA